MNPGPFGMAQTGVPFGEVAAVRDFLGISARVARIGAPDHMHPKRPVEGLACTRSEVSGARVWAWAAARFGTPDAFFRHAFVWNWCPLAFMAASGANLTPDKLPRTGRGVAAMKSLEAACDEALGAAILALQPVHVVGFGAFARDRAEGVLAQLRAADPARALPAVHQVLHPSPASPAANRGWAPQVDAQLAKAGIVFGTAPILRACASPSSTSSGSRRASSRGGNARSSKPSRSARAASGR
jgi:single-strand selective monofunctional uracil DNA glycosylase